MQEAQESGYSPIPRKPPFLRDFAPVVLKRFDNIPLDPDTKRYYRNGWSRLETTHLAGMRLDWITSEAVDALQPDGSPSWQNQALRTLSVILTKARGASLSVSETQDKTEEGNTTRKHYRRHCGGIAAASCRSTIEGCGDTCARHGVTNR